MLWQRFELHQPYLTIALRKIAKTVSSQPNLGISQTNHGVAEAREKVTVLTGFCPFSELPGGWAWPLASCGGVPMEMTFRRGDNGNGCLPLKHFCQMDLSTWQFLSVVGYLYPFRSSLPRLMDTTSVKHSLAFELPSFLGSKAALEQKAESAQMCLQRCWLIVNRVLGCFCFSIFLCVHFMRPFQKEHSLLLTLSNSFILLLNLLLKINVLPFIVSFDNYFQFSFFVALLSYHWQITV